MKYDVDYFIKKFTKIPASKWTTGHFIALDGNKCALGHCGQSNGHCSAESTALRSVFCHLVSSVAFVNDGIDDRFQQKSPRARILAALRYLKKKGTK